MVSVPVRVAPELLVAMMKLTVPFPLPGPALITAIHATLLAASHAHVEAAVTTLLPNPPSDVYEPALGEIDVVQAPAPACVTVNVVAAIVTVPLRDAVPTFGATLKATLPEPDPPPLVTVIQDALLVAAHPQLGVVVTALAPVPPSRPNAWLVGETLYVQPAET